MNVRVALLVVHAVLLLLALTELTIVTGVFSGGFHWVFYRYASQSGWGRPYEFPYPLPVVLVYLAAYGTGLVAFELVRRAGSRAVGVAGIVLCGLGFLSFAYELTHWVTDHYGSWILSAPIVLLPLTAVALAQQYRGRSVQVARPEAS